MRTSLFLPLQQRVEESQRLFRWPFCRTAETHPMPNRVVGDYERDDGKPKKREGLWKLKSEPVPNRTSEPNAPGIHYPGCHVSVSER
jgi:hypothetical protein